MASSNLQGKKVAILVTDGFEQSELLEPRKALDEAGATTKVVSPAGKKLKDGIIKSGATKFRWTLRWILPGRKTSTRCCCRVGS